MEQRNNHSEEDKDYVISYLTLRKAIGILGIALPLVLILAFIFLNPGCGLPPSISHYFYTNVGTYFTGTLCAVSLFMYAYKGPAKADRYAALLACVCALGVAFCPTNPYGPEGLDCIKVSLMKSPTRNFFHYAFAGLLFLTLAFFSLILFTKSDGNPTPHKRKRNLVYKVCGIIILLCITGIIITTFLEHKTATDQETLDITTYILETISLMAFGFSWLVKGEMIIQDK